MTTHVKGGESFGREACLWTVSAQASKGIVSMDALESLQCSGKFAALAIF